MPEQPVPHEDDRHPDPSSGVASATLVCPPSGVVHRIAEFEGKYEGRWARGLAREPSIAEDARERIFWLGPVSDDKHGFTEWNTTTRFKTLFPMHRFLG